MSTIAEVPRRAAGKSGGRPDFAQRMRNLTRDRRGKTPVTKEPRTERPENLQVVRTLDEYKNIVGMEKERIIVVKFFATWCKACKAIRPAFHKLVKQYPNVLFVEVPVSEKNSALHQGLGVPSLPFGHIYHPSAGLVEELKIARKHFPRLADSLQSYVYGACDLPDGDSASPFDSDYEELGSFQ
eukprot:CAMPEP_0195539186 /NCGR_PEP_ID=MMETSP0794_2-20130614/49921_1 /TAXON_ID=515487 /ORGANISM="Stephanopyxis turris, Strain CCMP 815" /LENGTH=183 /DNA_ID=CAMNT_0040673209 /DNA_START=446 /DNA_END=997 /DNA_ORIENTATION=-